MATPSAFAYAVVIISCLPPVGRSVAVLINSRLEEARFMDGRKRAERKAGGLSGKRSIYFALVSSKWVKLVQIVCDTVTQERGGGLLQLSIIGLNTEVIRDTTSQHVSQRRCSHLNTRFKYKTYIQQGVAIRPPITGCLCIMPPTT